MGEALLLIDIQNDYFKGGRMELVHPDKALVHCERVLESFRQNNLPIIHVQHVNLRQGATFFLPDTDGAKIHPRLTPLQGEYLVLKHAPNSFFETNLIDILDTIQCKSLVVCGMMSHMCIDTTVRSAKDHGLAVTLLADACATKDLTFHGTVIPAETVHNAFMAALQGTFANVIVTNEYL